MKPGDRIRNSAGAVGKVLRVEGADVIVDFGDGPVRRRAGHHRPSSKTQGPRGIATVPARVAEARRLFEQGWTRAQIADRYRVSVPAVQQWLDISHEAEADARHRAALGER